MPLQHLKQESLGALEELPHDLLHSVSFYEQLDASFNCLTSIPTEFSVYVPHLSHLDLSHNTLLSLPESFGYLFHLKTLLLNHNKLKQLPESICLLVRLEKADLSHNILKHLPQGLGRMEALRSLNVSNNELEALPSSLGESKTLNLVLAIFNKCRSPPQLICNQGSEAILQFLRKQSPKEPEKKFLNRNEFPRVRGDVLITAPTNPHTARTQYVQTQTNTSATSRIRTPLRPPAAATDLPPEDLVDRVVGCLYGAAIGDAIGLCAEFMTPDECRFHYEKDMLGYKYMIKDRHRSKWQKGDWTDSFDQMVSFIMEY